MTPSAIPNPNNAPDDDIRDNESIESAAAQRTDNLNRKRTYDVYQDLDVTLGRELNHAFALHAMNVVASSDKVSNVLIGHMKDVDAQIVKHADVAMDGLWTDVVDPVTRGAGNALAGQAPVNSQLASTASLDTVFGNLTAQYGEMVSQVVGLAKAVMQTQSDTTKTLSELVIVLKSSTAKTGN